MNLRILTFVLLFAASSAQAALVGYYDFNASDGSDSSGAGNDAIFVGGGVSFSATGGPNGDGSAIFNGVNSTINVPININASNIPQLTMGAWVHG